MKNKHDIYSHILLLCERNEKGGFEIEFEVSWPFRDYHEAVRHYAQDTQVDDQPNQVVMKALGLLEPDRDRTILLDYDVVGQAWEDAYEDVVQQYFGTTKKASIASPVQVGDIIRYQTWRNYKHKGKVGLKICKARGRVETLNEKDFTVRLISENNKVAIGTEELPYGYNYIIEEKS